MASKLTMTLAAATVALFATTLQASATSMPTLQLLKDTATSQSTVEQAHFWHRMCRRGANGSHKHVKGVGRIQCTTGKCFTNKLGYKQCKYF